MPVILFVCMANRYRSPIAAACFRRELAARRPGEKWEILSAGTWALDGQPAMPDAIHAAAKMGLDIGAHTSRAITAGLMQRANLVIVMEQGQKEALVNEFRGDAHKVLLLSELGIGMAYDIPDPVQRGDAGQVPEEICRLVMSGFDRICLLAGGARNADL